MSDLIEIFEDTIKFFNNEEGELSLEEACECIALDPETVDGINLPEKTGFCNIEVTRNDSYGAALGMGEGCLVLNFMSGWNPGGGVTKGARAQEEDLCRRSSLYLSLTSEDGMQLYDYNRENAPDMSSNYMLLSPKVEIIKTSDGEYIEPSMTCAVLSAAAPRLIGEFGFNVDDDELEQVLESRIHGILQVAAKYGYRRLILGAWGCGAYRNDPEQVARIFRDELSRMTGYFDDVEFAVYGKNENYECFAAALG